MNKYIENPKMQGSGLLDCIPQKGECPVKCKDCFFNSGRSYLEPLEENLPNIPSVKYAKNRIVRINGGGNDSNNQRELVEKTARQYDNYFFNTSIKYQLEEFSAPVVFTINPTELTDCEFKKVDPPIPNNLMFIRIRTNLWNIEKVVLPAIDYYTQRKVVTVLTFMAYYTTPIPEKYKNDYIWKQRTINSYWCLKQEKIDEIMGLFKDNSYVYSCGVKGQYGCKFCGNCIREYFVCQERLRTRR